MILARLADADRYAPLHPLFAPALAWLRDPALAGLASGRYALDGERLFAIIDETPARDPAQARLESHRAYIDIQVNLAHGERMDWAPVAGLPVEDDFQPDGDIRFHAPAPHQAELAIQPGWMCIFYPEDAHRPLLHLAGPGPCRKVVVKVALRG